MVNGMVSLIIPVYNRQDVIEECIQSVFSQTYQNIEIVLIDDGSSDNTLSVCQCLAGQDGRIKLLQTEHVGVSAARNKAIDAASGEYLFFLDSDDVIYPLLLETLVHAMVQTGAEMAGTRVLNVSETRWDKVQAKITEAPVPTESFLQSHQEALDSLFHGTSVLRPMGGTMVRRSLVRETRFRPDLYIGEDFYFLYENLIKGASCAGIKDPWYYARMHKNNSSWDYSFSGFWTRFFRRELVWKSEESFGRTDHANTEKRNAFGCFLMCYRKNTPYSTDSKKMRKVLRDYQKILFPAQTPKAKILYILSMYLPWISHTVIKHHK